MDFKKIKGNLIHKTAIINWKKLKIGKGNIIGPYVVIGTDAQHIKDKSNDDKSYKKRIALWNDRKDHLANIVRTLSQVEGTKMTTNLIQIQDGIEDIDDE